MSSLAEHIADLRAYHKICAEKVNDETLVTGSIEHFFADEFRRVAGVTFWRHLEEIAALLPNQEELAQETADKQREMEKTLPVLHKALDAFDGTADKTKNANAMFLAGVVELFGLDKSR